MDENWQNFPEMDNEPHRTIDELIVMKEADWKALNKQFQRVVDMADRCRESDMMDMAETYDEQADQLIQEMEPLEDWLIDHDDNWIDPTY